MRSLLLISLFLYSILQANEVVPNYNRSNFEGRHFLVGFMQNEYRLDTDVEPVGLRVLISTRERAEVTMKVGDLEETFTITSDNSGPIPIPSSLEVTSSGYVNDKLVEIYSDNPIYVSVFNTMRLTSDIYTAIPTARWGNEYVLMSMPTDHYIADAGTDDLTREIQEYRRPGEFMIMAREDNTMIEITPSCDTETMLAGNTYQVYLNKGQAYFLKSIGGEKGENDLTGTILESSAPVGVLSGHLRSSVPTVNSDANGGSKDHLVEMLTPVDTWGTEFITKPWVSGFDDLQNVVTSYFKLTSYYPNTIVSYEVEGEFNEVTLATPGDFVTIPETGAPTIWRSNQPVQLAQFMARDYTNLESPFYDPCMVMIQPTNQFTNSSSFIIIPDNIFGYIHPQNVPQVQYAQHHVGIIASYNATQDLRVNGILVRQRTNFRPITNSDYWYADLNLRPGNYLLESKDGSFTGVIYGNGYVDSYAHILGSNLKTDEEDIWPPEIDVVRDCYRIEGYIFDDQGDHSSGFGFIQEDEDSTFNVEWEVNQRTDTSAIVDFYAQVIDKEKDASFVFNYHDNTGNGRRYRFFYEGRDINLTDRIDFGNIVKRQEQRVSVDLSNASESATVTLLDIVYDNNLIDIPLKNDLPLQLSPSEVIQHEVIINDMIEDDLSERIEYIFDCDITKAIRVEANVNNPSLVATGKQLDTILVESTKCDSIEIVNNGDTRIIVERIVVQNEDFIPDTTGMFSFELEPGESRFINICFTPNSRGLFSSDIIVIGSTVVDEQTINLVDTVSVSGIGAAPEFTSQVHHWGRVRTGKTERYTIEIENTGNYEGEIEFLSYDPITDTYINDPSMEIINSIDNKVYAGEKIQLQLEFTPMEVREYQILANIDITNWDPHQNISIQTIGEGIQPDIETISHCFDTLYLGQTSSQIFPIIESTGDTSLLVSELLEVRSVKIDDQTQEDLSFDEDPFYFITDLNSTQNSLLEINEFLNLEVEFRPEEAGIYVLELDIYNDALPLNSDPEFNVQSISFCAIAIDKAPVNVVAALNSNIVYACDTTGLEATITNTDQEAVQLNGIEIRSEGFSSTFENNLSYPMILQAGDQIELPIDVFFFKDEEGELILEASYTDLSTQGEYILYDTLSLKPQVFDLKVSTINMDQEVNEDIAIILSGDIPFDIDYWLNMLIQIEVDRFYLYLKDNRTKIKFNHTNGEFEVDASIIQNGDIIEIIPDDTEIPVFDNQTWSIDLPAYTLFHREQEIDFTVRVTSDNCFIAGISENVINLEDLCLFNERQIVSGSPTQANTYPNPIKQQLNLELNIPFDDVIDVIITNNIGEMLILDEKKFVIEGNHLLNYDLTSISAGNYYLIIRGDFITEKKLIIKSN